MKIIFPKRNQEIKIFFKYKNYIVQTSITLKLYPFFYVSLCRETKNRDFSLVKAATMKKQILIVDDELSILKLLNFILSNDYELVIKNSGIEAVNWLEEGNDPDLIISDLHMPYFDGNSFIKSLKTSGFYRNTPVILLSGEEDLEYRVSKMPFKVDYYIQKPFNPDLLKSAISDLLIKHDEVSA